MRSSVPAATRSRRPDPARRPSQRAAPRRAASAGARPGARARRDNQPVVVGKGAVGKRDAPRAKIDRRRAHTKAHIEREGVVPVLLVEKRVLRLQGALEHLFRERRAVVGAMWLVT